VACLVGPLSWQQGRFTFGESRVLSYAWFINGVPLRHWQGEDPRLGKPVHPTRVLIDEPRVFEFAAPVGGTYPVWTDPAYWHEGVRPYFNAQQQAAALIESAREYYGIFFGQFQLALLVGIAILLLAHDSRRGAAAGIAAQWPLVVPLVAGFAMFAVVRAFPRYVAPFVVLFSLTALAAVRLRDSTQSRRLLAAVPIVIALFLVLATAKKVGPTAVQGWLDAFDGEGVDSHPTWSVAQHLTGLGIRAGDHVAVVHPDPTRASWSAMTAWARLARVRIIAEVPPESSDAFWNGGAARQSEVLEAFARVGARAVVAFRRPAASHASAWRDLGDTPYSAHLFETGGTPAFQVRR
jgi:hypothetical protein